jgi:hypothetical protein
VSATRWLRRHAIVILGLGMSALLLYLAFRGVDWPKMAKEFWPERGSVGASGPLAPCATSGPLVATRHRNFWILVVASVMGLGGFVLRAVDWKYLLAPVGRFQARRLFPPVAIGYMANNILPARLGELVRACLVGKREGVSKSSALATIIVERIFDGLTLLLILAVVLLFCRFPKQVRVEGWTIADVQAAGWVVAAVFLGVSVSLAVVAVRVQWVVRLVDATLGRWAPSFAEKMKSRLECFVAGLNIARYAGSTALAFLACVARWAFEAFIYFGVVWAMDLHVPPHGVLFVLVAVNIMTMVPGAPGYVGNVQIACVVALGVLGIERETALAYSVLLHVAILAPITVAGLVCMVLARQSFAGLRGPEVSPAAERANARNGP